MSTKKSSAALKSTNPNPTITNTIHDNDVITFITLILTPAIFTTLLTIWNISINDFITIKQATYELLPSVLSRFNLTSEATEALTFVWLSLEKNSRRDFYFGNLESIFALSHVKEHHTNKYKAKYKLFTNNINKLRKINPITLSSKNALSLMRKLWDTMSRFFDIYSNSRDIIKTYDRPIYMKIAINKIARNKMSDMAISTKITHANNPNYLDEETDDEEIQQRQFDIIFEDEYEKDMYFEVVLPELARRAAEADDFNDEITSDDMYEFSSEDDMDEWHAGFDDIERASLQYTY